MERVMLATDFSPCSRKAQDLAISIAAKFDSELHVFHSVLTPVEWSRISIEDEKKFPETKEKIAEARTRLADLDRLNPEIRVKTFVGFNATDEDIVDHAEKNDIDLIVMGTHGESGFKEMVLGSNAKRVLELSSVPVLVAKMSEALSN